MRSYGQNCALAKALDMVGDRWTLLIVRELMIHENCRYTDLRNGLPGIATNLLSERLNEMEQSRLVTREVAPPPVATTLYRLTARGRELEPVVAALGRWGAPLLTNKAGKEAFCDHWVVLPLRLYVRDQSPSEHPARIGLRAGKELVTVETTGDGSVRVEAGFPAEADARLEGPALLILSVLAGKTGLAEARAGGLKFEGDRKVMRRFGVR